MDLSVALIIAASFAILCTFYIGKRILTIDFSEYSSKNSKKAKLERLLAKKETPLQNSKIRRDMRNAFERILIPLGNSPWFSEIELELSDGNRPDSPYTDLYRQYEQRMHELADILMRRDNRNRVWDGGSTMNRVDSTGIRQERPASAPNAMGSETWVCPSCGAQSSGKFCANCGTPKPVASSGCTNCGWRPSAGQGMPKFCPECGRPLR